MVAYIVWRKVGARNRKVERVMRKIEYFIRKIEPLTRKMTPLSNLHWKCTTIANAHILLYAY